MSDMKGIENLTLDSLRSVYEYIRDKDLTDGAGLEVKFDPEDKHIHFVLKTVSASFAEELMVPEIQKYLKAPVLVNKQEEASKLGACIILQIPEKQLIDLIAVNSNLEQLRTSLSPDFGYAVAKGIADYLITEKDMKDKEGNKDDKDDKGGS